MELIEFQRIFEALNSPLHRALPTGDKNSILQVLETGSDINARNKHGLSALTISLMAFFDDEIIATLLCHGAVAEIRDLELAVMTSSKLVQEMVFRQVIDDLDTVDIKLKVVLKLAAEESELFDEIIDRIHGVVFDGLDLTEYQVLLKQVSNRNLRILMESCELIVERILFSKYDYFIDFVHHDIEKLNTLIENEDLRYQIFDAMGFGKSLVIPRSSEDRWSAIYCLLLSYGMTLSEICLQEVYHQFGRCQLFNILLHMEIKLNKHLLQKQVFPMMLYDVRTDLYTYFDAPFEFNEKNLEHLLNYYANPHLNKLCYVFTNDSNVYRKIETLPKVPKLQEIVRDKIRYYFVDDLKFNTSKDLRRAVSQLPIPKVHQKIILLDRPLYF